MLKDVATEFNLNEECVGKLEKLIQSETDKVRTDYSQKLKLANNELESLRPKEKSDAEIELEQLKAELNKAKFEKSLKEIGVDDGLSKYLRADIDLNEFGTYYKGFTQERKDYVAKKHVDNCGITKEQFRVMNISERTKLYQENPELYNTLRQ